MKKNDPFNSLLNISLMSHQRPKLTLLLVMLISLFAFTESKNLKLDADLAALLPESFKSVQDLAQVKSRFGGIGYVVLAVTDSSPDNMRHFADDVALKIKPLDHISFVDYKRPVEFFQDRSLYYLNEEDLSIIQKRLKKRWKWEKRQRNPMYIDLEESAAPSMDFSDLQDKYNTGGSSNWMAEQQSTEAYYFDETQSMLAIFIKPNMTSSDLNFSKEIIDRIQQTIDSMDLSRYGDSIKVDITGRYKKKIDLQYQMQQDMGVASLLALTLVVFYLLFHFRRLESLVLIVVPLLLGILCTFAFAAIVFEQLNILTAFIGVILMGLGIDHGIHLLSRYRDEMRKGETETVTIRNTFIGTGKSVGIAALTTFIIFVGLGFSEFRAFHEFGIIAAAGMIFIMLAYLIVMPALLYFTARLSWKFKETAQPTLSFNRLADMHSNHTRSVFIVGLMLITLVSLNMFSVRFNYDFESLGNSNLPSFQLDRKVNELLGYSQTPMVALTRNIEEEAYVSQAMRNAQQLLGEKSGLDFSLSTADLLPDHQIEKQIIIKKIAKIVKKVRISWLNKADLEKFEDLKRAVNSQPFEYQDLPEEIRQLFGGQESVNIPPELGAIMLFPSISLSDGKRVMAFADELRGISQSNGDRVPIAGESMILADILTLVFAEGPKVLLISTVFIFVILLTFVRKVSTSVISLIPAFFTISLTLGIMSVLGIELNYINMVMIPILLGIGIDSGVHMIGRAMDGERIEAIINETGMAIFGSILTSGLGLGALLLTNHPGLNSLAIVAIIGLLVNLIVSVMFLPSLIKMKFPENENYTIDQNTAGVIAGGDK